MIVYNVTVSVNNEIASEWLNWMQSEHILQLMETGLFTGYKLCRLLEQEETNSITYVAQYYCAGMAQYDAYINEHAAKMRGRSYEKFGNKFVAFRTLMELVSSS